LRPARAKTTCHQLGKRLLRYSARPPVALERLEQLGDDALIYRLDKPQPGGLRPWN
jgi:hypothetical protein